ncbi:hypothetical protein [Oceanihabitans sediminis]|uniref:Uncharacterized protein n=1 Tax=Oceanihabitans sediminis TaxID=1812012 RepID=A0A368P893_9FLAO|nr:hypothetical protein [Oceanihabitans sediminis]MDX1277171.1 hypothetical protein [Oceanihabitans sediminis]MDX1773589.1 hypothetical protein [Oceanihabitans sediminis]RBP33033.1 hypothetical protein DFR65_102369 [Oceanihabitans sediminis]RCU57451.1 hypothetical protein DU428_06560 [Oceanihabitans sediminis]
MRTNNNNVKNLIISVYFVLALLAIVAAIMFRMFSGISDDPVVVFLVISLCFGAVFFIVHAIAKYFEYDSDGMKVVVTNKGLLLSDRFNYREHTVEFHKKDLSGFKLHNYGVYTTLVLLIKDKRGNTNKERFNVTLVSRKKRKYIRQSLSKMIKQNR